MIDPLGLFDLYSISIELIETYENLDVSNDFALYASLYLSRSIVLASFVVLKLTRGSLDLRLEKQRGEQCYFKAINLVQRRALNFPDLDTKAATILTDLWSSKLVFRDADGNSEALRLRIRSRLVSNESQFDVQYSDL